MRINTPNGLNSHFDDGATPSIDDMNDIIGSVSRSDEEFLALCQASTTWARDLTNEQFLAKCEEWINERA